MIVSFERKFIFLRTMKTGSTSVELALAELCGPDDILTNVSKFEEHRRGRGQQNNIVPLESVPFWSRLAWAFGLDAKKAGIQLPNHAYARTVRRLVTPEQWAAFTKITIERNPWDREVSHYLYRKRNGKESGTFAEFVRRGWRRRTIPNFDIYAIDGKIVADEVMRFESLSDDFDAVMRRLGVENPPQLRHLNISRPGEKADYRTFYDDRTRATVARRYAREIEAFGYRF
jgi:hypothetical protein